MKRIWLDWRYLPAVWLAWMLLLWAGSSVFADTRYIPLVYGASSTVVLPARFVPPVGYGCLASQPSWLRTADGILWTCNLRQGAPGAGLFLYDGQTSRFLLSAGESSGDGSLTVDNGAIWFSWFPTEFPREQRNIQVR